jgi:hypothetical protein
MAWPTPAATKGAHTPPGQLTPDLTKSDTIPANIPSAMTSTGARHPESTHLGSRVHDFPTYQSTNVPLYLPTPFQTN